MAHFKSDDEFDAALDDALEDLSAEAEVVLEGYEFTATEEQLQEFCDLVCDKWLEENSGYHPNNSWFEALAEAFIESKKGNVK